MGHGFGVMGWGHAWVVNVLDIVRRFFPFFLIPFFLNSCVRGLGDPDMVCVCVWGGGVRGGRWGRSFGFVHQSLIEQGSSSRGAVGGE